MLLLERWFVLFAAENFRGGHQSFHHLRMLLHSTLQTSSLPFVAGPRETSLLSLTSSNRTCNLSHLAPCLISIKTLSLSLSAFPPSLWPVRGMEWKFPFRAKIGKNKHRERRSEKEERERRPSFQLTRTYEPSFSLVESCFLRTFSSVSLFFFLFLFSLHILSGEKERQKKKKKFAFRSRSLGTFE